jgi:Family of unknown function (DUF5985)
MIELVTGMLAAGNAVVALFFLRFWRTSRDRLFAMFAAAFFILAVQRIALALTRTILEERSGLYVLRLIAFVLIIVAIWDKNRR